MSRSFILFLILAIIPVGLTAAQSQDQANSILNSAIAVHGGSAVNSVHTIILRGTLTPAGKGNPGPVTVTADLDGSVRVDYSMNRAVITTPYRRFEILAGRVQNQPS